MSVRIWHNLPSEYRAAEDPFEIINLWRGDTIGKTATGMLCQLEPGLDPEVVIYQSLFKKYPNIKTLVKRHCHNNHNSPFVSLTDSHEIARHYSSDRTSTIYTIALPAHRLVLDQPSKNETPRVEALAIGLIRPEEIIEEAFSGTAI